MVSWPRGYDSAAETLGVIGFCGVCLRGVNKRLQVSLTLGELDSVVTTITF